MMHLPNEIIAEVLGHLTNRDLKQTRLVNKRVGLLSLHHFKLDMLYLSPREKDIEVFDGITQHLFIHLSLEQYYRFFQYQFDNCGENFNPKRHTPLPRCVQEYINIVSQLPRQGFRRFMKHLQLYNSDNRYVEMAREQANLLSRSWFSRVSRGYKGERSDLFRGEELGIPDPDSWDLFDEEEELLRVYIPVDKEEEDDSLLTRIHPLSYTRARDGYQGRSPAARTWSAAWVLPMALELKLVMPGKYWEETGGEDDRYPFYRESQILPSVTQ
ncbi:MAG: hypothetical protein Q9170_004242 [Blastenia crenularia]